MKTGNSYEKETGIERRKLTRKAKLAPLVGFGRGPNVRVRKERSPEDFCVPGMGSSEMGCQSLRQEANVAKE